MKLGLIGCGDVTEYKHLIALQRLPEIQVVAVADLDAERLQRVANQFGIARRSTDFHDLLADRSLDAVGICVPAHSHVEVALSALDAGKHLLIEKSLALNLDECDRLIERAQDSSSKIMVGFHMRWHHLVRQARAMIRHGRLGKLEAIRTTWNSPVNYEGNLPGWRNRREQGGGALVEIAVHHFDLWRFLLDSEVEEIFALSRFDGLSDETATVSARMTNGVLASAFFSERTSHDIEVEIYGRKGRLRLCCQHFDGLQWHPLTSVPGSVRTRLRGMAHSLRELPRGILNMRYGSYLSSYREEWRHFARAIRTGTPVESTLEDGRRALQVVLAAAESASLGVRVQVSRASRTLLPVTPDEML